MFGLIDLYKDKTFALKSLSVYCDIKNVLFTCTSEFIYKNDYGQDTEAIFTFPLDGSCAVYYFSTVIDGKEIEGICKEIEEAKNIYKIAKEAGHKAALITRDNSMTDIFNCRIGNMPQGSVAKITLKFVMELNLSLNKSECAQVDRFSLCLPLILRPRYMPSGSATNDECFNVNNLYDYKFQAFVSGSKEIKDIFSNNYQLKVNIKNEKRNCAEVVLDSLYNGSHDLDIYIDYIKMKSPSVIYEYGTLSEKFNGKKTDGAFYKTDVAMLHFLPEFNEKKELKKKVEVVFVVDRSGSMVGSNIKHAKECLLIFLKSLPVNSKFQIYGFGSTFDKVFPQPQLYDEQSIEIALNYQRNIEADFGGTELMNPLNDIYNYKMTNDYTRIVFLLTDGDVGNQDEVFKLVRLFNHSTRLFTVGIGDGVSTSLVQKVAESGYGKAVFVRDSKTLSASVIELLDIALNCDQFTDCKIEWICPKNTSIVMVPNTLGPIFSNYFLTVFCMIKGVCEGESVKCHLSGKVNGKFLNLSLDVNDKDGISDDEFRVHRLLAKYKIDEMTPQIKDGREDLKKSLIELSLAVNMVTNFTTFVAIDKETLDKGLVVYQKSFDKDYFLGYDGMVYDTTDDVGFGYDTVDSRMFGYDTLESRTCFEEEYGVFNDSSVNMDEYECASNEKEKDTDCVLYLAEKQCLNGSWKYDEIIILEINLDVNKVKMEKPDSINNDVWMTVVVYNYLLTRLKSREKEWRLFAKKALEWIDDILKCTLTFEDVMKKALLVV